MAKTKFIARFKKGDKVYSYSIIAEDLFEADVRAQRLAKGWGEVYIDVTVPDADQPVTKELLKQSLSGFFSFTAYKHSQRKK